MKMFKTKFKHLIDTIRSLNLRKLQKTTGFQ